MISYGSPKSSCSKSYDRLKLIQNIKKNWNDLTEISFVLLGTQGATSSKLNTYENFELLGHHSLRRMVRVLAQKLLWGNTLKLGRIVLS